MYQKITCYDLFSLLPHTSAALATDNFSFCAHKIPLTKWLCGKPELCLFVFFFLKYSPFVVCAASGKCVSCICMCLVYSLADC